MPNSLPRPRTDIILATDGGTVKSVVTTAPSSMITGSVASWPASRSLHFFRHGSAPVPVPMTSRLHFRWNLFRDGQRSVAVLMRDQGQPAYLWSAKTRLGGSFAPVTLLRVAFGQFCNSPSTRWICGVGQRLGTLFWMKMERRRR